MSTPDSNAPAPVHMKFAQRGSKIMQGQQLQPQQSPVRVRTPPTTEGEDEIRRPSMIQPVVAASSSTSQPLQHRLSVPAAPSQIHASSSDEDLALNTSSLSASRSDGGTAPLMQPPQQSPSPSLIEWQMNPARPDSSIGDIDRSRTASAVEGAPLLGGGNRTTNGSLSMPAQPAPATAAKVTNGSATNGSSSSHTNDKATMPIASSVTTTKSLNGDAPSDSFTIEMLPLTSSNPPSKQNAATPSALIPANNPTTTKSQPDSSTAASSSIPLSQIAYPQGPKSPLAIASWLSVWTVGWANAFILLANKRSIAETDVPELPERDQVHFASQRFQKHWQASQAAALASGSTKPPSVARSLFSAFGAQSMIGGFMLSISYVLQLLQPFVVQKVVNVLKDETITSKEGYLWAAALVLVTFFSSMFLGQHFFNMIRCGNSIRIACISAIYEKSLKLSRSSRQVYSTGSTVNIMSNDTQRLFDSMLTLHFTWLSPAILITALILMYFEVGVAAVAGVVLFMLLSPLQVYISRLTGRNRRELLVHSDQRVKLMSEVLSGIRVVKLYAWEDAIAKKVEGIRDLELSKVARSLYLSAMNQTLIFVMPAAVAAVIMSVYAALGHEVDVSNTFAILAYLNIMRNPTILIPMTINALAEARVSMSRIQKFLTLEELTPKPRQEYDSSIPYAISVRHGTFVWSTDQPIPSLRDITLQIKTGSLVAIIGHVGSGKSSLIAALLGEMVQLQNHQNGNGMNGVSKYQPSSSSSSTDPSESQVLINGNGIAYVSQEAWIRNDTVRGNILFGLPYHEHLYAQVLEAACLKHDLTILPHGDQTEIGERGINLSGGQRSRVSIARALYRHELCDIYLLDDPFAAVDMSVGSHIFQHALQGLVRTKTRVVVLSSHLHLLEHFDQIIVIERQPTANASGGGEVDIGMIPLEVDPLATAPQPLPIQAGTVNNSPGPEQQQQQQQQATSSAQSSPASPSPGGSPGDPAQTPPSQAQTECGVIAAIGTFNELKSKYWAMMSQRNEEGEDEFEELGDEEGGDGYDIAAVLPRRSLSSLHVQTDCLVDMDANGAAVPHTPATPATPGSADEQKTPTGDGSHTPSSGPLSATPLKRTRTISGGASKSRPRLGIRTNSSRGENSLAPQQTPRSPHTRSRGSGRDRGVSASAARGGAPISVPPPPKQALIEREDRGAGGVSWSVYTQYFSGGATRWQGIALLITILLLFLCAQTARVGSDTWLSIWSAKSVWTDKSTNFWITVYFLIIALTLLFSLSRSFGFARYVALSSSRRIHDTAFNCLLRASTPEFFDVTPIGRTLNRLSKDVDQLDNLLPTTLFQFAQNVFILLGVIAVCISSTWYMVVLFVPIGFLFFAVQRFFRNSQRELKRIENTTRSPIFSLFSETLAGLGVIRAYGVEDEFKARNRLTVEQNSKVYALLWWSNRWLALRLDWVSILVVVAVAFLVIGLRNGISVGVASLALVYSLQFTGLLQLTTRNSVDVENYSTSIERLLAFNTIPSEKPALIPETEPDASWPQTGAIQFKDLQLRYRADLPLVLKGISCSIKPQEKIGVCGRTGSGKSSLMVALFRLVEPTHGQILIDGIDVSTIGLQTLRSHMSIIPQDPVMFSATVRYNLDPFSTCTEEEIQAVLQRVHLSDIVKQMEKGLETQVSEGGENLSMGTRQLICIARALLRKTTSSVDAETDSLIQETIRVNFSHATVLTIAHRLETIVDSDRIMLLSDGKLLEMDSPHNLLSNPTSFRQLVSEGGAANLTRLQALAKDADQVKRGVKAPRKSSVSQNKGTQQPRMVGRN